MLRTLLKFKPRRETEEPPDDGGDDGGDEGDEGEQPAAGRSEYVSAARPREAFRE